MRYVFIQPNRPQRRRGLGQSFDPSVSGYSCTIPIGGLCDQQIRDWAALTLDRKFQELQSVALNLPISYGAGYVCQLANQVAANMLAAMESAYRACSLCWGDLDYTETYNHIALKFSELNNATGLACSWQSTVTPPASGGGGGTDYGQSSACNSRGGRCQSTSSACSGQFVSNLCPGPASWRCCAPTRTNTPAGGGGQTQPPRQNSNAIQEYIAYGFIGLVGLVVVMNVARR